MQRALLDVGLGGVLSEGAQRVADLRHVDVAVPARVEQLERLLELCNEHPATSQPFPILSRIFIKSKSTFLVIWVYLSCWKVTYYNYRFVGTLESK